MLRPLLFIVLSDLALAAAVGGCSLGNIHVDACGSDAECASAFGAGSACMSGYCSAPMSVAGMDGGMDAGCTKTGPNGPCFSCPPTTIPDYENACTTASCVPFDDKTRLTKLTADGGVPPLPAPPAGDAG